MIYSWRNYKKFDFIFSSKCFFEVEFWKYV